MRDPIFAIPPRSVLLLVFLICFGAVYARGTGPAFRDEFNGPRGTAVDGSKWTLETGGSGWGNKELQYYTTSSDNAYRDGNGRLVIKADKADSASGLQCWYGPCRFTSARLITKGKFDQKYGRFEARIKVPRGKGVWPAFWLLGNNIDAVGWPRCGEIDIMEHIGREPRAVYGTLHGPGYSGAGGISGSYIMPRSRQVSDDFHVYAVEWYSERIRWYVDGKLFKTITPGDLPAGQQWVFDRPFFIILNFAVGGEWPGAPDDATTFPQEMLVDYVRVYQL